jgi:hypothetical protein
MKKYIVLLVLLFGAFLIGCEEDAAKGPNELGGETNIPLSKVGNAYSIALTLDGNYLDIDLDTAYITKNDNGIVTVKIVADISKVDPLLRSIIPSRFLDVNGNVNGDFHFKVTSEGIQEYYYSDSDYSKPFTIVKYDMGVGTSWSFTTNDGKTINRSVTEKTGLDEWPLTPFLSIKTTKTEESNPAIDGVSKAIFRTNHRFGLVYVEYVLTTGSSIKIYLYPLANL